MRLYKTPTSFVIVVAAIILIVYSAAAATTTISLAKKSSDNETSTEPINPSPDPNQNKNNCDNISIIINHKHNSCNDNGSGHSGHKGKGKSSKGSKGDTGNGDLLRETEGNQKLADSETLAASKGLHGQIDLDSFSVVSLNNTHYNISWTSGQDSRSYIVRK